jgi:HAD superfamily hydrolase (TIGR01549 family)
MQKLDRIHGFPFDVLKSLRGILIDLDDTLSEYEPCHQYGLAAAFACANLGFTKAEFDITYRQARTDVTARLLGGGSCRSRLFAFQLMCERHRCSQPYMTALALEQAYWDQFIASMQPHPVAARFLNECRALGLPVCVVSDMTAQIQIRKLAHLNVLEAITHLVTSEEIGCEKPSSKMFEAGLKKIGLKKEDVAMIGDDLAKDVNGASAIGIRSYQVRLKD